MTNPRLDLGRIVGRSFAIIGQRWRPLGFFWLAYLAIYWADIFLRPASYKSGSHDTAGFALLVATALGFVCLRWARDTAFTATALQPASSPPSISLALRQTLPALPTLLPFALLIVSPELIPGLWRNWSGFRGPGGQLLSFNMAVSAGTFVWDIAFMLSCGLIIPVIVAEREGLVASLGRAWRLLSGNRWRFLALYVAVLVAGAVPGMIGTMVTMPIAWGAHAAGQVRTYFQIESAVTGALAQVVQATWQVMIAVAYLELRRAREGVAMGDVAEIFA